ncbi:cyclin-dependent protein kinase inhibitor SMR6-like [Rutidosis leptorrhynchoides]|uniref:cyclin-dependent protein kinase inhibitor SMR6-like n=1 Tax=Rutidosis leptorrhynchoides TaxID=125765 RepID=UPI003A99F5CB
MRFSKKHQADNKSSKEGFNKWTVSGIKLRAPLKSISISNNKEEIENSRSGSTTPTNNLSRIPDVLLCPPPPRKRRPVSTCHNHGNIEYFTSPDIDSLFKMFPNTERAS